MDSRRPGDMDNGNIVDIDNQYRSPRSIAGSDIPWRGGVDMDQG